MGSFEMYRKVEGEIRNDPASRELLQASSLQMAWAEMNCAATATSDEAEHAGAIIQWIEKTGHWFREQVLDHETKPGNISRKDHFLSLYNSDPDRAVTELDALFKASRH